jgi:IS605 OrfB family transposase
VIFNHDGRLVPSRVGGRLRFFGSKRRPLPDNAKGGAFVEDALGRWYICFHVEVAERQPRGNGIIGIDLGLNTLVATSDGQKIEAPRHYRQLEVKLAVAQRAHNKQRARRIHAKIKNCRKDFLHKLSTTLAGQNAIIAVGDVNPKQLAKTRMSKSVLDAGWSTFRSMLKYKSAGYVEVDEKFTTVTCSACGVRGGPQGQKGLRVREWQSSACGADHDRDVNSALNILAIAARSASGPVVESRVAA